MAVFAAIAATSSEEASFVADVLAADALAAELASALRIEAALVAELLADVAAAVADAAALVSDVAAAFLDAVADVALPAADVADVEALVSDVAAAAAAVSACPLAAIVSFLAVLTVVTIVLRLACASATAALAASSAAVVAAVTASFLAVCAWFFRSVTAGITEAGSSVVSNAVPSAFHLKECKATGAGMLADILSFVEMSSLSALAVVSLICCAMIIVLSSAVSISWAKNGPLFTRLSICVIGITLAMVNLYSAVKAVLLTGYVTSHVSTLTAKSVTSIVVPSDTFV